MSLARVPMRREDEVNEHELMSKWELSSKEDKIRFLNLVFDELCGTARIVQEGDEGKEVREEKEVRQLRETCFDPKNWSMVTKHTLAATSTCWSFYKDQAVTMCSEEEC